MTSLAIAALALVSTSANAQVPDTSVFIGGPIDVPAIYDILGGTVPNPSPNYITDGGTPKAYAVGPNETLWVMDCNYDALLSFPNDESMGAWFTIPSLCTTYVDLENTEDGTLLLAGNSGTLVEVNPATGALTGAGGVSIDDAELVQSISYADGHLAFTIDSPFNPKEVIVMDYPTTSVQQTLTFANQPGDALLLLDRFEAVVGTTTMSLTTEHTVSRHSAAGVQWSVSVDAAPIDIVSPEPNVLWVLMDNGSVARLRTSDGISLEDASFLSNVLGGPTPTAMEVADWGVGLVAPDECPDNPAKTEAGICGCDYADVPASWPSTASESGTGCVHMHANYDPSAHIRDGAFVDAFATVGPGASISFDAIIAQRATLDAGALIGSNAVIQRNAFIGAGVTISSGSVIGRQSRIEEGASTNTDMVVGFGTLIQGDGSFAIGTVVGNLVTIGPGTYDIGFGPRGGPPTILGRGVTLSGSATIGGGVVIGPDSTLGDSLTIGDNTRIRKNVTVGPNQSIGANVRIGRSSQLAGTGSIGDSSRFGTSVSVTTNQCVADGTIARRADTIDDQSCEL